MNFLDIFGEPWPSIAEAILAFFALILAVVSGWQTRKVKTLTDVVTALSKQTEVMSKSLEINDYVTRYQRMPHFIPFGNNVVANSPFALSLVNKGIDATYIEMIEGTPGVQLDRTVKESCLNNNPVSFNITVSQNVVDHFFFVIKFNSHFGHAFKQRYQKIGKVITVHPPEVFNAS